MVEADRDSITTPRLSRRAALKRAAGAIAATAVPVAADASAHPDASLLALERALRAAEAKWQHALDRLAQAERRLFALYPAPPPEILIPESDDSDEPIVPAGWPALRRHLRRVHRRDPALKSRLATARRQWACRAGPARRQRLVPSGTDSRRCSRGRRRLPASKHRPRARTDLGRASHQASGSVVPDRTGMRRRRSRRVGPK